MRENSAKVSAASVRNIAAIAAVALCATAAWAATYHSTDETITDISGNNVFNGNGTTITFVTTKDKQADGWLSVEGNYDNPVTFASKDDLDDYGYIINGSTYVAGGGGSGSLTIKSGTYTFKNQLFFGQNGENKARLSIEGGVFDSSATQLNLGQSENTKVYYSQTGGIVCNNYFYISPGKDSYAEMDFSGGSFTNKGVFTFGWNGATTLRDTAKIVVSGTADVVMQGNVTMGYSTNRIDYITLNGGRMSVKYLTVGNSGSQGIVTFNGGTLRALESNGDFLSSSLTCNVSAKGAIIDTQSYSPTVSATLAHDSSLGEAVDGGLVKRGAGTLTLTAMPTFTGALCVREGKVVCPGPIANLKGTKETKVSDTQYEYTPCKGLMIIVAGL